MTEFLAASRAKDYSESTIADANVLPTKEQTPRIAREDGDCEQTTLADHLGASL
jgi:hypothetical protein